jgi:hypothetical protein
MKTLDEIAKECGTDKSSLSHNYCSKYERFLPFSHKSKLNILEIGIFRGESLKMWKQFYPNSKVLGIDIQPDCKEIKFPDGIEVLIGNATDDGLLSSLQDDFDLIIDDGSHESYDMIYSFEKLFPKVKSGGVYIIEDTVCSYWEEYNSRSPISVIEYLKGIVDSINFHGYKLKNNHPHFRNEQFILSEIENSTYFQQTIDGMMFCNSTVIIFKK